MGGANSSELAQCERNYRSANSQLVAIREQLRACVAKEGPVGEPGCAQQLNNALAEWQAIRKCISGDESIDQATFDQVDKYFDQLGRAYIEVGAVEQCEFLKNNAQEIDKNLDSVRDKCAQS